MHENNAHVTQMHAHMHAQCIFAAGATAIVGDRGVRGRIASAWIVVAGCNMRVCFKSIRECMSALYIYIELDFATHPNASHVPRFSPRIACAGLLRTKRIGPSHPALSLKHISRPTSPQVPIVIVNDGETRADPLADLKVDWV